MKLTKKNKQSYLRKQLAENKAWATRALQILNGYQIEKEAKREMGQECYDLGFSERDSEFLKSLHNQFTDYGRLSAKQYKHLHKLLPKYWEQIYYASETEELDQKIYESLTGVLAQNQN
jgi:hypothetical protein